MILKVISRIKSISPIEFFILIFIAGSTIFMVKQFRQTVTHRLVRVEVSKEYYDLYGSRVPFWLSQKIKVGSAEKDLNGNVIARVEKIENYIRSGLESEIYLTLDLVVIENKKLGIITFKDKPASVNSLIGLTLDNISINGMIVDDNLPTNGYPTKFITVTARGRNFSPAEAANVTTGLKMYDRGNNEVIAEITQVKTEPSSQIQTTIDKYGNLHQNINQNKDVIITAKLKVVEIDQRWYFSGHSQIKPNHLGDMLYLYTEQMDLPNLLIETVYGL